MLDINSLFMVRNINTQEVKFFADRYGAECFALKENQYSNRYEWEIVE